MFVDRVMLYVKAGDGGNGALSFRREKYAPRGGPNGGDGGNGGSVILRAAPGLTNLAHLSHQRHWKGENGDRGMGSNCHGKTAPDLIIDVPPGTIVRDRDREFVLKDLTDLGDWVIVAKGGRGGHGNTHFKSSTNRAPRQHEPGQPGEERAIVLELKVIADVGLVGLPNAGKSTLLSRISRATPEIADYPFTTKFPNLGMAGAESARPFLVADIPGLIEGAHSGHGLGHDFLRHVERTRLLVHLVDSSPVDGTDPVANYRTIRKEIELYSDTLAKRPEIVVLTKADLNASAAVRERFQAECDLAPFVISAVTGKGIPELLAEIGRELDRLDEASESSETTAAASAD